MYTQYMYLCTVCTHYDIQSTYKCTYVCMFISVHNQVCTNRNTYVQYILVQCHAVTEHNLTHVRKCMHDSVCQSGSDTHFRLVHSSVVVKEQRLLLLELRLELVHSLSALGASFKLCNVLQYRDYLLLSIALNMIQHK